MKVEYSALVSISDLQTSTLQGVLGREFPSLSDYVGLSLSMYDSWTYKSDEWLAIGTE